jgi:hypothetical protein
VNRDEAKSILLLYRHGTADAADPQIAGALALAERDPELKDWLVIHCAREFLLREKLRQIAAPAGLKEQIISEQAAGERLVPFWHRKISQARLFSVAAVILLSGVLASLWFANHRRDDNTLAVYQNQMAGVALRGYLMDLATNDPAPIRAYLAQNRAPSDFILPESLNQASLVGCAIEGWQGVKVSMICFRSRRAAPEVLSDVWLFVVDRTSLGKLSAGPAPQFSKVNRLMTATWIQGDKLYFLGTTGDAQAIQQYL